MSETSMADSVEHEVNAVTNTEIPDLAERCNALKARIADYERVRRARQVRDDLIHIADELKALADELQCVINSYLVLRQHFPGEGDSPLIAPLSSEHLDQARVLLKQFRQAYDEKHEKVRQSDAMPNLTDKLKTLTSELDEYVQPAWRDYVAELRNRWLVNMSLFDGQLHIQERKIVYDKYQQLSKAFNQITCRVPKSSNELKDILKLQCQLEELHEKMDLDIPAGVDQFLKVVGKGGATLDLLTDEVLQWLRANDNVDSYRIKRL